jgi:hypothetical protein
MDVFWCRGWAESDRGVSFTFGADVVEKFNRKHDFDLIVRAHQVNFETSFIEMPSIGACLYVCLSLHHVVKADWYSPISAASFHFLSMKRLGMAHGFGFFILLCGESQRADIVNDTYV